MQKELIQLDQILELKCLSKSTQKTYIYHLKKWLKYYSHNQTEENVIKHLVFLKKHDYSPEYIALARAALVFYFKKCKNIEIGKNIESPKRRKALPKPVSRHIIDLLIKSTTNLKHRVLLELMYDTGLRRGEVIKLRWEDIDLINGELRVNQGKGNKDRLIGIGKDIIQHLLDLKISTPKNNPFIFFSQSRTYTHITGRTVEAILENTCKKANLGYTINPHRLRHSFATHSLEIGTDIRVLQELLGHSSPKTTMRYTKVTDRTLLRAKSPLDELNKKLRKSNLK